MKRNGFTLVELLVAITISTVLAAVAIPKFHAQVAKAKASEVPAMFSAIAKMQHISYLETQTYQNCETSEQFNDKLGIDIGKNNKYFTYVTGTSYEMLAADVPVDEIPMEHMGFWTVAYSTKPFGKLGGGEKVEYLFDNTTQLECAATEDDKLLEYLRHYLFYDVGIRQTTPTESTEDSEVADAGTPSDESSLEADFIAEHKPPKHNHGHGNNYSGIDISNPGKKPTETVPDYDDEMPTGNSK